MTFHFIHAADLHIDSPLESLGAKDRAVAGWFADANRKAVEALVKETIEGGAKFLVIAGDVFDGAWRDVSTGLYFARQLGVLQRAGVPVFIVKGNHDADSVVTKAFRPPANVHIFHSGRAETKTLDDLRVALHGRSFADRGAPDGFVASYPARREGWLNIGVLHTGLDGVRGHDPYAPCTVEELRRFGYDYWALGHIHAAEIVARDPFIVYPGNIQGRSPRETGAKGAMKVSVDDGRIADAAPLVLDAARWEHVRLDVSPCADLPGAEALIADAVGAAWRSADGRPLALRITLTGSTPLHAELHARRDALEGEARNAAALAAAECWVERLRLETIAPSRAATAGDADAADIDALVAAADDDAAFAGDFAALIAEITDKLPAELRAAAAARLEALRPAARAHLAGDGP